MILYRKFLQVPRLLAGREVERLLDFTDQYLVTTFRFDVMNMMLE